MVDYGIHAGSARMSSVWTNTRWYVHCANGTRVDAGSLREITFTEEAGLR